MVQLSVCGLTKLNIPLPFQSRFFWANNANIIQYITLEAYLHFFV